MTQKASEITVTGFNNTTLGSQTIKITYQGYTTSFEVEVVQSNTVGGTIDEGKTVTNIKIAEFPKKLEYIQNYEELDLTGGIITVTYEDSSTEEIAMTVNDVTTSGFDNSILGNQIISITYENIVTTMNVTIISKSIESIEIKTLPTKIEYMQNREELDLTNGTITVIYNDGTTEVISMQDSGVTVSGFNNSIAGERAITVSYKEKTTTFTITIIEVEESSITAEVESATSPNVLPLTGGPVLIIVVIIAFIVIVLGTVSGKKYIKYLKDTHKQLK